jgi:hypothetical protein
MGETLMPATIDGPTSITIGNAAPPRFAQDLQTRTWVLGDDAPETPTRLDVMKYAQRELANLRRLPRGWDGGRGVALRPELATLALVLVEAITVEDGLATPLVSPLSDGGLYITWLVGGDRLTMTVEHDELDIRGVWREGHEAFRLDRRHGSYLPSELESALNDAQSFLLKISAQVQHQLFTS